MKFNKAIFRAFQNCILHALDNRQIQFNIIFVQVHVEIHV
jgi:histidinol phosphatase-like enzyme